VRGSRPLVPTNALPLLSVPTNSLDGLKSPSAYFLRQVRFGPTDRVILALSHGGLPRYAALPPVQPGHCPQRPRFGVAGARKGVQGEHDGPPAIPQRRRPTCQRRRNAGRTPLPRHSSPGGRQDAAVPIFDQQPLRQPVARGSRPLGFRGFFAHRCRVEALRNVAYGRGDSPVCPFARKSNVNARWGSR